MWTGGDHVRFSWYDKGRKEFKVDVGSELIRMDEKGVGLIVSVLIL